MIKYSFCLLILVLLSRCTNAPENTSTKEQPVVVTQAVPEKHYVSIMGMKFKPELIKVHKGDTIVFSNMDIVDHDVTDEKTGAWTSSVIPPGSRWSMAVKQSSDYFCSIHVVMKGKIVVE
jgi:plastocyanin